MTQHTYIITFYCLASERHETQEIDARSETNALDKFYRVWPHASVKDIDLKY